MVRRPREGDGDVHRVDVADPGLVLVVLAAGLSTRYGADKQLQPVGPGGATLMDYGIYDAIRAGYARCVIVIRADLESEIARHIARSFGDAIDFSIAIQRIDDLPPGFEVPEGRQKPWGPAHALLAARHEVDGPFVVMNADDFYGAEAFHRLAEHLRRTRADPDPDFAAAGYRLTDTLSPHGGVSRAVCQLDRRGYLRRVIEVKDIRSRDGELIGLTVDGEPYPLSGDETISMNLWAATPRAIFLLEREFRRFLERKGGGPDAEFLLSSSVNDQIARGEMRVKVIPVPGPWLGMTFEEDRRHVAARIGELVQAGEYPVDLAAEPPAPLT